MAGTTLQIYTVDAFTDVPFKGNPAAVCPLPVRLDLQDDILQKIAIEMNLSETAYIKLLDKDDTFKDGNKQTRIVFKTLSGELIVKREGELLHMDFPVGLTVREEQSKYEKLIKSLGNVPGLSDIVFCDSLRYLLIRLQDGWSRAEFEEWTPDIGAMKASTDKLILLIITTRGPPGDGYQSDSGAPYDFVSRCFAPWMDIPEDPVTGSAQTVLAHYWSQQLGKNDFFVKQCSARGGEIWLKLRGDRVEILGKAAFVMEGEMKF